MPQMPYRPPTPARGTGFQNPLTPPRDPASVGDVGLPTVAPPRIFQQPGRQLPPRGIPFEALVPPPDREQLNFPSGFEAGETTPGTMSYGGPPMNTEAALAGLRSQQESQDPRQALLRLASQQRMDPNSTMGTRAYDDRLTQDVMSSFAPDQERRGIVEGALQAQHPAIQGLAEQEAQRAAYPQIEEATGRTQAAMLAAKAAQQGEFFKAGAEQQKTAQEVIQTILAERGKAQERQRGFPGRQFADQNAQEQQLLDSLLAHYMNQGR